MRQLTYRKGNKFVCGSTRSGKSVGEWLDIVAAAERGDVAIVVMDPHESSLAWNAFQQLISRGHEHRIVFDQLHHHLHVPGYRFLKQSKVQSPTQRLADNEETARGFADILCRRGGVNIASQPQKEEWILKAIKLLLCQRSERQASDLRFAFQPESRVFKSLLSGCTNAELRNEFLQIGDGSIKRGTYNSAARLIEGTCGAQSFVERCGTTFDLESFLDDAGILLVEGGIDADVMGTIMGALQIQVINYCRRRGTDTPRVLLVLDECNNASLISDHETRAMAECQKMGLDIHVLCQLLDFPSPSVTNGVLSNCVTHEWYWNSNPSVINKAVEDLGLRRLVESGGEPGQRIRNLSVGECYVKRRTFAGETIEEKSTEMLPNPWGFPKLAAIKTHKALSRVRKRPEYQTVSPQEEKQSSDSGDETDPKSDSQLSPVESLLREQEEDYDV